MCLHISKSYSLTGQLDPTNDTNFNDHLNQLNGLWHYFVTLKVIYCIRISKDWFEFYVIFALPKPVLFSWYLVILDLQSNSKDIF